MRHELGVDSAFGKRMEVGWLGRIFLFMRNSGGGWSWCVWWVGNAV